MYNYINFTTKASFALIIALLMVTVLGYQSLSHDYNLDDAYVLRWDFGSESKTVLVQLKEIWSNRYNAALEGELNTYGFRPIAASSFVIEQWLIGRQSSSTSHGINLLLYALSGLILFIFLRQVLPHSPTLWPLLAMLLFLTHPLHAEVFNSLKNREELLGFMFSLGAINGWLNALKLGKIWRGIGFFLVFGTLAVLSKESYLSILGLGWLLVFLSLRYEEFKTVFWEKCWPKRSGMLAAIPKAVSLIPITVGILILGLAMPAWNLPEGDSGKAPFAENPFAYTDSRQWYPQVISTLIWYLTQFLAPGKMLFYYGYDMVEVYGWTHPLLYTATLLLLLLMTLLFYAIYKRKWRALPLIAAWFAVVYAPLSNVFFTITGTVAERLFFAPSAALSAGLAGLVLSLPKKYNMKIIGMALALCYVTFLSFKTHSRSADWKDRITLFEADAPYLNQSVRANVMLGNTYAKQISERAQNGEQIAMSDLALQKAQSYLMQALSVDSSYDEALFSLGRLELLYLNEPESALQKLRSVTANLESPPHRYLVALGQAFIENGQSDSAYVTWVAAMELRAETWLYDAVMDMLFRANQKQKAAAFSTLSSTLLPDYYLPQQFLGDYHLFDLKDTATALGHYRSAVATGYADPKLLQLIQRLELR